MLDSFLEYLVSCHLEVTTSLVVHCLDPLLGASWEDLLLITVSYHIQTRILVRRAFLVRLVLLSVNADFARRVGLLHLHGCLSELSSLVLKLHCNVSTSLVSLHCHIRWRDELLASLLVHLGESGNIRITVDHWLVHCYWFRTIASRCLLRIIVVDSSRLLDIIVLWLLANDIEHTGLKALLVS